MWRLSRGCQVTETRRLDRGWFLSGFFERRTVSAGAHELIQHGSHLVVGGHDGVGRGVGTRRTVLKNEFRAESSLASSEPNNPLAYLDEIHKLIESTMIRG